MTKKITLLTITLLFCISLASYAAEYSIEEQGLKLSRGLTNMATCWLEFPNQIFLVAQDYDPLTGLIYGPIKGVAYTVLRAAAGTYDTATFVIPTEPLITPEYVFEGW